MSTFHLMSNLKRTLIMATFVLLFALSLIGTALTPTTIYADGSPTPTPTPIDPDGWNDPIGG